MPSNWLFVDTNFPSFTGEESTSKKIDVIQNYLYMLVEQLRYTLFNLDMGNMNESALDRFSHSLTDPIYVELEDAEGHINHLQITAEGLDARISDAEGNLTSLQATATGLAARISDAEGNLTSLRATAKGLDARISDAEGNLTSLQATASGLAARISNAEGDLTSLQATASGLAARISSAEGSITTLQATANGIMTSVGDLSGEVSTLRQTVNGFELKASNGQSSSTLTLTSNGVSVSSADIEFRGMVTFRDLSDSGSTTINGDNITTGTVDASHVRLGGTMVVYQETGIENLVGGYLGYITSADYYGDATHGMGIMDSTMQNQVVVTNAGARLSGGQSRVVAAQNLSLTTEGHINASKELSITSDRRLKGAIRYDIGERWSPLLSLLMPASFVYTKDKAARRHLGFIAQDAEDALETLGLAGENAALVSRDEDGFMGLAAGELTAVLWAGLQALQKRVETLEKRLGENKEVQT